MAKKEELGGYATFWEHLNELRLRLAYMVATVLLVSIFVFMFGFREVGALGGVTMYVPWPMPFDSISAVAYRGLQDFLLPDSVTVFQLSPFDALVAQLKISFFLGFAIGMPVIVYNIGRFVGPGLYRHEKWILFKMVVGATFLFALGSVFALVVFLPVTYKFLFFYSEGMGVGSDITIDKFISFTVMFTAAFGVVFETPVVMSGLSGLGIVKPSTWLAKWRWVIMIAIVGAAAITPDGTGVTQMMVALPMLFLYFIGYLLARRSYSRHQVKRQAALGFPPAAKGGK